MTTPDDDAAIAANLDALPSPDDYAANGYRLNPRARYEREHATWAHQLGMIARAATTVDLDATRAAALLVGGQWLDGPFRPIADSDRGFRRWLSDDGVVVLDADVQARRLAGDQRSKWVTHLDAEPLEDCPGVGFTLDPKDDDDALDIAEGSFMCGECDTTFQLVGSPSTDYRLPEHDRRGRLIVNGRTVTAGL